MKYRNYDEQPEKTYSEDEYLTLHEKCQELADDNEKWESDFRNLDEECAKTIAQLEAKIKQLTEDKKDLIEAFSTMTNLLAKQIKNL